MAVKIGLDCFLYRNTATWGTPTWNPVDLTIDAALRLTKVMAEIKKRGVRWMQHVPGVKSGPIEFNMVRDVADADHDAIRDYYLNDTLASWAFADGAIATVGTQYFKAEYYVDKFEIGQPIDGHETIDVALSMAYSSNAPAFTTVS
jgi:hypothetical protein